MEEIEAIIYKYQLEYLQIRRSNKKRTPKERFLHGHKIRHEMKIFKGFIDDLKPLTQ